MRASVNICNLLNKRSMFGLSKSAQFLYDMGIQFEFNVLVYT